MEHMTLVAKKQALLLWGICSRKSPVGRGISSYGPYHGMREENTKISMNTGKNIRFKEVR